MRWWVVAAGVFALASCGSGDENTTADSAATAATDAVPTSPTRAPTSPPSTRADDATTTTTTTTTTLPPTTVDPAVALAEQVEADYREGWRRYRLAQQDPANERTSNAALRFAEGSSRQAAATSLDSMRQNGLRILPEPEVEATIKVESGPTRIGPRKFELQACVTDPWVLVETGAGPNGSDAIVDDNVYAYRNRATLVEADGTWKVTKSIEVDRWVGTPTCAP